jgi:hypothetical protein
MWVLIIWTDVNEKHKLYKKFFIFFKVTNMATVQDFEIITDKFNPGVTWTESTKKWNMNTSASLKMLRKIQGATVKKDFFSLNTMYVPSKCMQLWAQRNISERSNIQQYNCEKLKRYKFFTNVKLLLLFIVRTIKH